MAALILAAVVAAAHHAIGATKRAVAHTELGSIFDPANAGGRA